MVLNFRTIDNYLPELNSLVFRAGVEVALDKTRKKGYETEFEVSYHTQFGFIYPEKIRVGDKNSVDRGLVLEKRRYNASLLMLCDSKPWYTRVILRHLILRDLIKEGDIEIDYPKVSGYKSLSDSSLKNKKILELIGFHTHFQEEEDYMCLNISPSPADRKSLNKIRRKVHNKGFNNIEIILGVNSDKIRRRFPYLIIQESREKPLFLEYNSSYKSDLIDRWVRNPGFVDVEMTRTFMPYNLKMGCYVIGEGFKEADRQF